VSDFDLAIAAQAVQVFQDFIPRSQNKILSCWMMRRK
jgi:hypothetical protein